MTSNSEGEEGYDMHESLPEGGVRLNEGTLNVLEKHL